ncbi:MAG TPA: hypothetical protein VG944_06140, partial [Fimbriimonas sp.]|nr:hypothetical protein [Fimbriimonas sp.]
MNRSKDLEVLFVAGFGPIARDSAANRAFYSGTLGLPLVDEGDDYLHTDKVSGVKHLACWPLAQAATSCFGKEEWPSNLTIPQGWIEFDVADIDRATA